MQSEARHSQRTPAEWSGARALLEKWLARKCAVESLAQLTGGAVLLIFGLLALAFTSFVTAALVFIILVEANVLLAFFGLGVSLLRPLLFAILFVLFSGLSVLHAYRTRWGPDSVAKADLSMAFSTLTTLGWEFLSAGPIILILAIQDFQRYVRLSRMDLPHVSGLLLWLYDRGGRAGFAEISAEFPGLNAVRVLPQLRDIPGIDWWQEGGEISLSEELKNIFADTIGRAPKSFPAFGNRPPTGEYYKKPAVEVDPEIQSWYAALNLPLFANLQEVKARYRKLAKIHHPDARSTGKPGGAIPDDQQMKRINEAYHNILKQSRNRAEAG